MTTSVYMPDVIVEVAFNAGFSTPAASRVWTDVSAYVELNMGITIGYGRQDERSLAEANTLSLTFDNRDGRFTAGRAASPYYPNVKIGRPIRVTVAPPSAFYSDTYSDIYGGEWVRFVGYVDEWPVQWPGSDATSYVTVTATSRLARLGLNTEFRSVIEEEHFHGTAPAAYYTLGEPEKATSAGDSSGNGAPRLHRQAGGFGTPPVFGSATGPSTDSLTGVTFDRSWGLETRSPILTSKPAALTVETFFSQTEFLNTDVAYVLLDIPNLLRIALYDSSVDPLRIILLDRVGANVVVHDDATLDDGATRHVAATLVDGGTWTLYLDGVSVGTGAGAALTATEYYMTLGNLATANGGGANGIEGTMAHCAVYTSALTAAQILVHANSGLTGFAGESTDVRLRRYTRLAGLSATEVDPDTGSTVTIAHIDTTGRNVVDMLRQVESTEGGILFDERDGTLRMHNRSERYAKAAALTLNMATHQVGEDFSPRLDRSSIVNDARVANSDGTLTASAKRTSSIEAYGLYVDSRETQTTDEEEPYQLASWLVNTYAEPHTRVPSLTVDLLSSGADLDTVLGLNVSSLVEVIGMPSQAEASSASYFVEGYAETIGFEFYSLSFNVSPAYPHTSVLVLDDPTRVLDSAVIGY